ncbi:hypothetical protein LIER_20789 [Lithospermum erythrorhizon]|uniref:Uncharacterized protein n=1 Tax=Lithospermum erythrorhizon TaxID=34254 RepID=A0AAV3QQ68_LITER
MSTIGPLVLSITKRLFLEDHLMVCYFDTLEKKRHTNQWRKLTLVYVVLINLAQKLISKSNGWNTIGQLWSKIAWNLLKDVNLVIFTQISFTNRQNHYTQPLLHDLSMLGDLIWLALYQRHP